MNSPEAPIVRLEGVRKSFSGREVIPPLTLDLDDGEFVTLLGPSGCGKSTILRLIAGLEAVDAGHIYVDSVDVTRMPPNKRPVNMVFQRPSLFPHLSVFENVAFGLRIRRLDAKKVAERVHSTLEMVRLPGFEDRNVETLSGGEAQRVALARALVNRPKVLLLDEPLGALDLQIRRHLQVEVKQLHRQVGSTFVFVTHDQEEAMTMSDRIIVVTEGKIAQVGNPLSIYRQPTSVFTASFVGTSNLWAASVRGVYSGRVVLDVDGHEVTAEDGNGPSKGQRAWVLIRAEAVRVVPATSSPAQADDLRADCLRGTVVDAIFLGATVQYRIDAGGRIVVASAPTRQDGILPEGAEVYLSWSPADVRVLQE